MKKERVISIWVDPERGLVYETKNMEFTTAHAFWAVRNKPKAMKGKKELDK